jgi:hypothetical protein
MIWAVHAASMGEEGMHIEYLCEIQKQRDHQEGLGVRG